MERYSSCIYIEDASRKWLIHIVTCSEEKTNSFIGVFDNNWNSMENRSVCTCIFWTEWIFLLENASSLTTVGCLCRVRCLLTDLPSQDTGEPGWRHICAQIAWYFQQPCATVGEILGWLFSSMTLGAVTYRAERTLPTGCDLSVLFFSKLLGCSHIACCGSANGYTEDNCNDFCL